MMIPIHGLSTPRLRLAPLNPDALSTNYLRWLQDPEVTKFLEVRHSTPPDISALREFVRTINASENELLLGVFDRQSQTHIGNVKLGPIDFQNRRAVVGILIGEKKEWGKGIGSETIARVFDFAVQELELQRVDAGCYSSNFGSKRAFLRAGSHLEARLKNFWWHEENGWNDELILTRFRD